MSWVDYFQNATRLVNKKINSKAMVVNFAPEYFVQLTKLVHEYNSTSDGKMYVYVRVRCIRGGELTQMLEKLKNNFF